MALTKLNTDLNIIQALDDQPNAVTGLTPAQAKAKFDEAANAIKTFINSTLTEEIPVQFATKQEVQDIILGEIPNDSLTETKMASDMKKDILGGITSYNTFASQLAHLTTEVNNINTDITSVSNNILDIQVKLNNYNSYASSKDSNGIYTVVDYKRSDGTLYMKSTLSGGTSPNYTTDTWQFYDIGGTTVIDTKTWTITYDANGKITSKVVA